MTAVKHVKPAPLGIKQLPVTVQTPEGGLTTQDSLAEEIPVALVYNGISHAVMMASPIDLEDFARGFSMTESVVDSIEQILSIEIINSTLGIEVQIEITSEVFSRLKNHRRQLTGRTGCGLCGLESLEAIQPSITQVNKGTPPTLDILNKAIAELQHRQQLQQLCGAVHAAAYVSAAGEIITVREDVGRHNALDKLIGSFSCPPAPENFILVSSRASYEMVIKAATLGISTLVSVSAPTSMAVTLAKQANMTLIGFARNNRQVIYNHA